MSIILTEAPIMIGFSRRFDSNHRGVREAIQNGSIGKVEMMHLTTRAQEPPPISYVKVSGDNSATRPSTFSIWPTGLPMKLRLRCMQLVRFWLTRPLVRRGVDTSMLILKMPSGALRHIDNNRCSAYGYDERIEVFGSEGMFQSNRKPTHEVSLYTGTKVISEGLHPGWFERLEPSFALVLDAFINVLEGKKVPNPSLMDGLRVQIIAEAAVESLHTKQPTKITYWQPE